MFEKGDGTRRQLRPIQVETLKWIEDNYDNYDTFVLGLGVGSGKSLISRAIQIELRSAVVITPSNYLLDQYRESYPRVNYLKGMTNYECDNGLTCHDNVRILNRKPCEGCPYFNGRGRLEGGEMSFVNPMSFVTVPMGKLKGIIIDEAHTVAPMLLELAGYTFDGKYYNFPESFKDETDIINWIRGEFNKISLLIEKAKEKEKLQLLSKGVKLKNRLEPVLRALLLEPEKYHFDFDKKNKVLKVMPLFVPEELLKPYKHADKIFLLSGTVTEESVRALGRGRVGYFNPKSPIEATKRQVLYRPFDFDVNERTKPETLAKGIAELVSKYRTGDENTLIHIPYKWQDKLKPYLPSDWIFHDKKGKDKAIQQFKKSGGIFVASGCSEGVDFPNEQCRLNIIPIVNKPNIGDSYVKKRMTLADGREWYLEQVLVNTAQRIGRSTRGADDWSTTIVADPYYAKALVEHRYKLNSDLYIDNVVLSVKPE